MKKTVKIIFVATALFLVTVLTVKLFNNNIKLEMVQHGEMENSYSFKALVIRDETVINTEKKGILEPMVKDKEMVRKNKHVASIYETDIDDDAKNKLNNINKRIEEITKVKEENRNAVVGGFHLESTIDVRLKELMAASEEGDMERVAAISSELSLLNDRKNAIENGEKYTDDVLNSLMEDKAKYENKLGNAKEDLYSPVSGIFTTAMDGYEKIVTPDAIGTMTPYDFESVSKMELSSKTAKKEGNVAKIIDGFGWSVAFVATEKEISKLKEGSSVYIRNSKLSEDHEANISYISTPANGNYLVIATSHESCSWAMEERFTEIDLVRNKYKGLKVPIKALRVVEGETGVYTVIDGIVHFKKVKVLYKDTNYAIVEENNSSQGGLLLYDEVVVSDTKNLKPGKKIS
jgi:putative membrane fusion protein